MDCATCQFNWKRQKMRVSPPHLFREWYKSLLPRECRLSVLERLREAPLKKGG